MFVPAAVAILAAASFVTIPPRESSGAGVARHALDLRRDRGYDVQALGVRVFRRRRRVKPVDVRQKHEAIGGHHGGDPCREPIVIAVTDFRGRNRVVLVDDGNCTELEQHLDGIARVEIAAPLLSISRCDEDLRRCQPAAGKNRLIGMGKRDLPDGSRGLRFLQAQRPPG